MSGLNRNSSGTTTLLLVLVLLCLTIDCTELWKIQDFFPVAATVLCVNTCTGTDNLSGLNRDTVLVGIFFFYRYRSGISNSIGTSTFQYWYHLVLVIATCTGTIRY